MDEFEPGDRVRWSSHGGEAVGRVERRIESDTHEAGRTVRASPEEPQYLVPSESGEGHAVHRPEALTRVTGDEDQE